MNRNDVLRDFIEIEPLDKDDFLKVKETLTRIGIPAKNPENPQRSILWQSCHVFHKAGKYYICHFKQLFMLDGRINNTNFTEDDENRTEYIAALLEDWGLIRSKYEISKKARTNITIIPFSEKKRWELRSKYTIGKRNGKKEENYER